MNEDGLDRSVASMYLRRWYQRSNVWKKALPTICTLEIFKPNTEQSCEIGSGGRQL